MSLAKQPPLRSPAFLKFCHENTDLTTCCLCRVKPWVVLHYFGSDGGASMKPSDNEVARVCVDCHRSSGYKRRALIKNGYFEILEAFQNDALKLNRLYIEYLESKGGLR